MEDKINNSKAKEVDKAKRELRRRNKWIRQNESVPQFSPDTYITRIIPRLKNTIEKIINYRLSKHCTDVEEQEALCLEDYYINGLDKQSLTEKYGITRQAVDLKIIRFKKQCFTREDDKQPSFDPAFVDDLEAAHEKYIFSTLELVGEEMGISTDIQNYPYLYFLDLDILDETCKFIVPLGEIRKYRKVLHNIIQDLKNCFSYYEKSNLIYRIPIIDHPKDWEYRDKLITSLCESWIEIDTDALKTDKVRLDIQMIPTTGLKQARIIYDYKYPISKKEIDNIYQNTFGTSSEQLRTTFLKENNFRCSGIYWQYAKTPPDLKEEIINLVIAKNYAVKFDDVLDYIISLHIPAEETSIRTYLQDICLKSIDEDIYCEKEHLKMFPGLRFPKEQNVGQENIVVNAIWQHLKTDGPKSLKELKRWVKEFMKNKGLNDRTNHQIIREYCSAEHRVFINDGDIISNNPDFPEDNLKYVGKGLAKEKYAPFIVPLTVNELRKRNNNEISLSELHKILSSSSLDKKGPTRKQTETILRAEPELFKVENVNNKLIISLVGQVQNEENYEIDDKVKNVGDEPILRVSTEQRPNLSPAITFDWNKITEEMKRELWFLKTPAWGGVTFNLDEAISLFRYILKHSKNENLSTRIPQDLYEDWFYNTSKWDKKRYILDLVLNYESLLKEIKPAIKDEKLNGLMEITTQYFPEIASLLRSNEFTGVAKTIKDLSKKRNMLAHGTPLEMTRVQEATTIINFVGLYVYTVYTDGKLS